MTRPRGLAPRAKLRHDRLVAKPAIDISSLTAEEKLDLIDELWRSLSPDDIALSDELRTELDKRIERLEQEGPVGVPWEQVRAEMIPKP